MTLFLTLYFAYVVTIIVAMWKIYAKAGQPGWASIIPLYNVYILLKITGKPAWWMILFFIPFVNIVFCVWTYNMLYKSFGKDGMTTFLMFVMGVGFLQLGFGNAQYQGPYGDPVAYETYQDKTTFDFERQAV